MILRNLKLAHFRGVADLEVRDLAGVGTHRIPLPADADPGLAADAIRYALTGRAPGGRSVISEGSGYAFVEAGFRAPGGGTISVFRGVDRHGTSQASLREDSGMRITSGTDDVARRLEEILGADPAVVAAALCPESADSPWATGAAAETPAAPPDEPQPSPAAEEARDRATAAIEAFRRALRVRWLVTTSAADHDALLALGARLRRERTDTSVAVDRVVADRERIRARLRRVNEYRDLAARARTDAAVHGSHPAPVQRRRPPRPIEWCVGGTAVVLLALLIAPLLAPDTAPAIRNDPVGRVLTGFGFVIAVSSYLILASRRHGAGRFIATAEAPPLVPAPDRAAADQAGREALRARFSDLGDPDDPVLVDDLRARLSHHDEQAAPLQRTLERIDDALALLDVEAGRAARSLHRPMPPRDEAASGLAAGEIDRVEAEVARLGDAIHQSAVERDALISQGTPSPAEAARGVEDAFRALGLASRSDAELGASAAAEECATPAMVDSIPVGADPDAIAGRLGALAQALAAPVQGSEPAAATRSVAADPVLAAAAHEVMPALTGGRFDGAHAGADGELYVDHASGSVAVASLEPGLRSRIEFALRLRVTEPAVRRAWRGEPRCIVLPGRPAGFESDEDLASFAASHAPTVTQVVLAAPGAQAPAAPRRPDRRRR